MGLTFISGTSQSSCFKGGVECLKPFLNDIATPVYVVVPDHASLTAEIDLIRNLNKPGIVNFDVITLNKLARLVLPDVDASTVGSAGMLVKIKQIINKLRGDFKVYNKLAYKNASGFVSEIYNTILQLKASNITPADINEKLSAMPELVSNKMHDIMLVYKAYEEFLTDEIFDGYSKFNSVIKNIKFCPKINKAVFWFAKSETYTNQAVSIIGELIKYAREVYVSVPNNKLNKFYVNLKAELTETARACFKSVGKVKVQENLTETQSFIYKNLFNFSGASLNNASISVIEARTTEQEIEYIAANILEQVKSKKAEFADFNIVACNLQESKETIKNIFDCYKIPYNLDAPEQAKNNIVSRFIFSAFEVLKSHFKADKVLEFAKNGLNFFTLSELSDFENYIIKYGIDGIDFSYEFNNPEAENVRASVFNLLSPFYNDFVKSETGEEFSLLVLNFLDVADLSTRVERETEVLRQAGLFVEAEATNECFTKISDIFRQIKVVINKNELNISNFFDILNLSINDLKINLIPVISNAVFIGDAVDSYFGERDTMYICGATENAFPRAQKDVGLISDDDILNLGLKEKLSPSVNELNERFNARAFELLYYAKNTILTYSVLNGSEAVRPSLYAQILKKKVNGCFKKIEENDIPLVCGDAAKTRAIKAYSNAMRGVEPANAEQVSSLVKLFKLDETRDNLNKITANNNYKQLAIKNNLISVSEMESYANCPLQHFLRYVLHLKPQEKCEIGSLDTGNIIHKFVELFLTRVSERNLPKNLETYSLNLMNEVLNLSEFKEVKQVKINEPIINMLMREAPKISATLIAHLVGSNFKPTSLEKRIISTGVVSINNVNINGKIDRIDECDNKVRIIDYKTGTSTTFSYGDIYYGKAIQLPIYCYVLQHSGKQVVGMFYLHLLNKFNGKAVPRLNGLVVNDLEIIKNMDFSLTDGERSTLIEIAIKKDGTLNAQNSASYASQKQFNLLIKSAVETAGKIIDEINLGYAEPSVLASDNNSACKYCDYKDLGLCKNCKERAERSVKKEDFFNRFNNRENKEGAGEL